MPTTYYAKLTPIGEAKLANAAALEIPLQITQMGVGDGNGVAVTPEAIVGGLANERRRAALNTLSPDPLNANQIIAEQVIPEDIGGWYIRELGLYDIAGDLIAVANCPETYKPVLAEGSGRTQVIRMVLVVSSTSAVQLKIDPAVVLATRAYVDANVLVVSNALVAHVTAADAHPQYAKIAGVQAQTYTAFTTAGAAPNFTLTPVPAIAAYVAGQRFRVKFHSGGAGDDVLNVNALGNKILKQYDAAGAKVAAVVAASQLTDVEYDGVDLVILDPLPMATVTPTSDAAYADSSVKPAATSWVRGAMSAIATAAGFAASFGANGYIKLPSWLGSWIVQWGSVVASASSDVWFSFPMAFPNSVYHVFTTPVLSTGGGMTGFNSQNTGGCAVNGWSSSSTRAALTVSVVSIGK